MGVWKPQGSDESRWTLYSAHQYLPDGRVQSKGVMYHGSITVIIETKLLTIKQNVRSISVNVLSLSRLSCKTVPDIYLFIFIFLLSDQEKESWGHGTSIIY